MRVGRNSPNLPADVRTIQRLLNRFVTVPRPLLKVDGKVGVYTISAIQTFQTVHVHMDHPDGVVQPHGPTMWKLMLGSSFNPVSNALPGHELPPQPKSIAWGARVSSDFKAKVIKICADLEISPDCLMAAMAFESAETFSPSVKNAAGSGAVGLIQFMPSTADALGTSTTGLAKMTAVDQLDYVRKYFLPHAGKLHSIEDIYMAILYPAAIGQSPDHALFASGTKAYQQNKGLDTNRDGTVTVEEAASKVRAKLEKGLKAGNLG